MRRLGVSGSVWQRAKRGEIESHRKGGAVNSVISLID
jgi:hypothetical protein